MVQELVMETPSPQSVGLQFVQQYYTMLNKAPQFLHRFYSNNSSFLRGGLDGSGKMEAAVQGQQAIHNKIMELNFRDCHTKIVMVDSQVTLGDGVVIQVSGELSNNGQPLRRFMQTFVLALQSPKQYYVQNDILRYQDEVFPDDDENELQEESGETEGEEEHVEIVGTANNVQELSVQHYYGQHPLNNGTAHVDEAVVVPLSTPVVVTTVSCTQPGIGGSHMSMANSSVQSLSVSCTSMNTTSTSPVKHLPSAAVSCEQQQITTILDKMNYNSQNEDLFVEKAPSKSPELPNDTNSQMAVENEPKTYATMVSRKSGSITTSPNANTVVGPPKTVPGIPTSQASIMRPDARSEGTLNNYIPPQLQRPARAKTIDNLRTPGPTSNQTYSVQNNERNISRPVNSDDQVDSERRRPIHQYPDEHQIFVGNLPHDVTDEDLRTLFSRYGNVVDVRINNKATPKPNFGFIVFDDSNIVRNVLESKPVNYGSHRLNVEEKKKAGDRRNTGNDNQRMGGPRMGGGLSRGGGNMMAGRGSGVMSGRGAGGGGGGGGGGMNRGGSMGTGMNRGTMSSGRGYYNNNQNRRP